MDAPSDVEEQVLSRLLADWQWANLPERELSSTRSQAVGERTAV